MNSEQAAPRLCCRGDDDDEGYIKLKKNLAEINIPKEKILGSDLIRKRIKKNYDF